MQDGWSLTDKTLSNSEQNLFDQVEKYCVFYEILKVIQLDEFKQ